MVEYAKKLTKHDASGTRQPVGHGGAVLRLSLLAVPGLHHPERRRADERGRHQDLFRQAGGDRGARLLGRPVAQVQGDAARHHRVGHHAEGLLREEDGDDVDHHRQPDQRASTNAKFDFGVAMLPANKRRGSPTGGGNFYIFKKSTPAQQQAALKFIKWITSPERAAQWGIDTGYVAVRPAAWETPKMKEYVKDFPAAAVARDQLQYSVAELSTHENQRVTKALNDGLQAALTGAKTPAAGDEGRAGRGRAHSAALPDNMLLLARRAGAAARSVHCEQALGTHPRLAAVAAGRGAARAVHALPGGGDAVPQLFFQRAQGPRRRPWSASITTG